MIFLLYFRTTFLSYLYFKFRYKTHLFMFGYSDDENGKYTRKSMMATGKYKSTSTQISNMVSLNFGSFTFCAGELIELGLRALKRFL